MRAQSFGYWAAWQASQLLPPSLAFGIAQRLADRQWRRSTHDREAVAHNLSRLCGEEIAGTSTRVREVFRNFARYLVEFFTMHQATRPRITIEGAESFEHARRRGRGVIVLTAHLGNWELGAVTVRRMGVPMAVIALPHIDPAMDRLFTRQRHRCGLNVLPLGLETTRRSLHHLQSGECLGILGDRVFAGPHVTVSWCGVSAPMPPGPAVLSLRSGAPLVPTFLVREAESPWRFRLRFESPIWPDAYRAGTDSIRRLTHAAVHVLEQSVRHDPEQWLMFRSFTELAHTPIAEPT